MYVVDTSVYVPLIGLLRGRLRRVMSRHRFHMLDLTLYEACNVFWKECAKLHRIDAETAKRGCRLAVTLAVEYAILHGLEELDPSRVVAIAMEEGITVYDASYIALAKQLGAPIASNDRDILEAAPRQNVRAYSLEELLEAIGGQQA